MYYSFSDLRQKIRFRMRFLRKSLSVEKQNYFSKKIADLAFNYKIIYSSKKIGFFLSFDGELNTYPLIQKLWKNQKNIYVPVIISFSKKKFVFVKLTPYSLLRYNRYNILEPVYSLYNIIIPSELDIIFVPLVAFDFIGSRLGMGHGFYDVFLKKYMYNNFIPIGFSYDFQLVYKIPVHDYDIALPMFLTPTQLRII